MGKRDRAYRESLPEYVPWEPTTDEFGRTIDNDSNPKVAMPVVVGFTVVIAIGIVGVLIYCASTGYRNFADMAGFLVVGGILLLNGIFGIVQVRRAKKFRERAAAREAAAARAASVRPAGWHGHAAGGPGSSGEGWGVLPNDR